MKLFDKIQAIINSYDLKPLELPVGYDNIYTYLTDYPEERKKYQAKIDDIYFLEKYLKYISKGHYGFSIGSPIIPEWNKIIDEILEVCIEADSNFEIHQIKLKFGRICFYVHSDIIEDINDIEILITKTLYEKKLIY